MSKEQKNVKPQVYPGSRQARKQQTETESDFYHKHKNTFWTIVVLIILAIFFIINNTRKVPEHGAYPPNYLNGNSSGELQSD